MTKKLYDILKWLALVGLPAVAAFVAVLFPVWGLPNAEKLVATIAASNVLLGTLVGVQGIKHQTNVRVDRARALHPSNQLALFESEYEPNPWEGM